jgi:hypothetical protein
MTLHVSQDQGATWQVQSIVDPGPAAYSALVALNNGSVAILYERNSPTNYMPVALSFLVIWSPSESE